MTDPNVETCHRVLEEHYGEPVMPASKYCQAFRDWIHAIVENHLDELDEDDGRDKILHDIAKFSFSATLAIQKSNLLYRLIYLGQPLRTEKCPRHEGHWSGWARAGTCECQVGPDLTGWLPK